MNIENKKKNIVITSDYLVLGSGIAGLFSALKLADNGPVSIITKDNVKESNSNYAQGGIAAALIPPDTVEKHYQDTMKAGEYHNISDRVKILTDEGPKRIKDLIDLGVNFDKEKNILQLSKEGAHSEARVLHHKDFTGAEIINILIKHIKKHPNITIHESLFVYQLISSENKCTGCLAFDEKNHYQFNANATILATGGAGKLYKFTSNPDVSTGDGYILAKEAGCKLKDMEFIQFHPTTFLYDKKKSSVFLVTEAIRGDGAVLVNKSLKPFMEKYDKNENLASRDIVSRAIYKESNSGNSPVFLNCSKLKDIITKKYPTIYKFCKKKNIDITKDVIPITPAAHYIMGGVETNEYAETNINHLYAIGEVAYTGVHGANRLASNSLLEAIVFANRATDKILSKTHKAIHTIQSQPKPNNSKTINIKSIQEDIQTIMWEKAGIIREKNKLQSALTDLKKYDYIKDITTLNKDICETQNMIKLSEIIISAALNRQNSIGAHFIE